MDYDLNPLHASTALDRRMLQGRMDFRNFMKAEGRLKEFKQMSLGEQIGKWAESEYRVACKELHGNDDLDSFEPFQQANTYEGHGFIFSMLASSFVIGAVPEYTTLDTDKAGCDPFAILVTPATYQMLDDTKPLEESFTSLVKQDPTLNQGEYIIFFDMSAIKDLKYSDGSPCRFNGVFVTRGHSNIEGVCQYLVWLEGSNLFTWPEGMYEEAKENYMESLVPKDSLSKVEAGKFDEATKQFANCLDTFCPTVEQVCKKLLILNWCEPSETIPRIPKDTLGRVPPKKKPRKPKPFSLFKQVRPKPRKGKGYEGADTEGRSNKKGDRFWFVIGHWRMQPCGIRSLQRRKIWIAPHVAGNRSGVKINKLIVK